MSHLTAVRQKLLAECFCSRCGYRMIEGDEAYLSATTLEVGVLTHVIQLSWCLGCFSNFTLNAYPKTPRVDLVADEDPPVNMNHHLINHKKGR